MAGPDNKKGDKNEGIEPEILEELKPGQSPEIGMRIHGPKGSEVHDIEKKNLPETLKAELNEIRHDIKESISKALEDSGITGAHNYLGDKKLSAEMMADRSISAIASFLDNPGLYAYMALRREMELWMPDFGKKFRPKITIANLNEIGISKKDCIYVLRHVKDLIESTNNTPLIKPLKIPKEYFLDFAKHELSNTNKYRIRPPEGEVNDVWTEDVVDDKYAEAETIVWGAIEDMKDERADKFYTSGPNASFAIGASLGTVGVLSLISGEPYDAASKLFTAGSVAIWYSLLSDEQFKKLITDGALSVRSRFESKRSDFKDWSITRTEGKRVEKEKKALYADVEAEEKDKAKSKKDSERFYKKVEKDAEHSRKMEVVLTAMWKKQEEAREKAKMRKHERAEAKDEKKQERVEAKERKRQEKVEAKEKKYTEKFYNKVEKNAEHSRKMEIILTAKWKKQEEARARAKEKSKHRKEAFKKASDYMRDKVNSGLDFVSGLTEEDFSMADENTNNDGEGASETSSYLAKVGDLTPLQEAQMYMISKIYETYLHIGPNDSFDVLDLPIAEELFGKNAVKAIREEFGDKHMELFIEAFDKYRPEDDKSHEASLWMFMNAFSDVFGKFVLEESEGNDELNNKLNDVLKYKLDPDYGTKMRPELKIAENLLSGFATSGSPDDTHSMREIINNALSPNPPLSAEKALRAFSEISVEVTGIDRTKVPAGATVLFDDFLETIYGVGGKTGKANHAEISNASKNARNQLIKFINFFKDDDREILDVVMVKLEAIEGIDVGLTLVKAEAREKKADESVKTATGLNKYFTGNEAVGIFPSMSGLSEELTKQITEDESGEGSLLGEANAAITEQNRKNAEQRTKNPRYKTENDLTDIDPLNFSTTSLGSILETVKNIPYQSQPNKARDLYSKRKTIADILKNNSKKLLNEVSEFSSGVVYLIKNKILPDDFPESMKKEMLSIDKDIRKFDEKSFNFSVNDLQEIYKKLTLPFGARGGNYPDWTWESVLSSGLDAGFAKCILSFKKEHKNAKASVAEIEKSLKGYEDLSDSAAAKKLIVAFLEKDEPEMELQERNDMADLILSEGVAKIQTNEAYEDLAKKGSVEVSEIIDMASFRQKVLNMKYKVDGKFVEPFKKIEPADILDWNKLERHFDSGALTIEYGMDFLNAMQDFATESNVKFDHTIVYTKVREKIEMMIAEKLGVEKRMGEAGVRSTINRAFDDYKKVSGDRVTQYFQNYEENLNDFNSYKSRELQAKLDSLKNRRRQDKISVNAAEKEFTDLLEQAEKYGLVEYMGFPQSDAMSSFMTMNSPQAQWFRDLGGNIGRWAKDKVLASLVKGPLLTAGRGMWGATKMGLSGTLQTTLTPFRAMKYPLLAVAKPGVWFVNKFKKEKLNPIDITATLKKDVSRVGNFFKEGAVENWDGAIAGGKKSFVEPWDKAQYKNVPLAQNEKTTSKMGLNEEDAKIYAEKSDETVLEMPTNGLFDFAKYKAEIDAFSKAA